MPLLGFTRRRTAFVDATDEWLDAGPDGGYNSSSDRNAFRV
jgi:hypothetical protein